MSSAHVTFPGGPVPLPTSRPRRPHERWTESQARTLLAVVRDLRIHDLSEGEAEKRWVSVSKMFGRSVESCKATVERETERSVQGLGEYGALLGGGTAP